MNRFRNIIKTSLIGVAANLLLGTLKIIIGLSANSISIMSDAVNNFSDSIASIVSIITIRLASLGATKKHPFGFGRVEYFSGAIISIIVILTGVEFLTSSYSRIRNPLSTNFGYISLIVLVVAVVAKIILGRYTKNVGERENAPTLVASGQDALGDAIITFVTLMGALVNIVTGRNIDGYIGVIVSLFLLKAGFEMLLGIISSLLGERNDIDLARKIVNELKATDGIIGAYDLALHNYGPNIFIGDVNVELPDTMTIQEAYVILKPIRHRMLEEYGVILYIGFYSVNTTDPHVMTVEKNIKKIALSHPMVLQIHAFIIYDEMNILAFDVVADFECNDLKVLKKEIIQMVSKEYGSYNIKVTMERDFSFSE